MEIIIYLAICLLMGFWCYKIAEKNGRGKGFAGFMGFIFGLWAVIVYYLIGDTIEKKIEKARKLVDAVNKK